MILQHLFPNKKMIKAVVFDLDGVIRIGNEIIPGANGTIQFLSSQNIPFMICTNECRYTPHELYVMLTQMGLHIPETTTIYTAGLAVRDFFRSKVLRGEWLHIGIVGEQGLYDVIETSYANDPSILMDNDGNPIKNYLIIGTVNEIRVADLEKIRKWKHAGAVIVTTCCDLSDPRGLTIMPNHLLHIVNFGMPPRTSEPYSTGKPNPIWTRSILATFPDTKPNEIIFFGDTLYTDICLAEESGFLSGLVLTGNTSFKAINDCVASPDYIVNSIASIPDVIICCNKKQT